MIYVINPTTEIDIKINQGDDVKISFNLSRYNKPLDMANTEFRFGARYSLKSEKNDIFCECKKEGDSIINAILEESETAKLKAYNENAEQNIMHYDVQMIEDGKARRIIQGHLYIVPGNAHRG